MILVLNHLYPQNIFIGGPWVGEGLGFRATQNFNRCTLGRGGPAGALKIFNKHIIIGSLFEKIGKLHKFLYNLYQIFSKLSKISKFFIDSKILFSPISL